MTKGKLYLIRGTGIGFFLSSLAFVFTWSPLALILLPLGGLVGYALSRLPERAERAGQGGWQAPAWLDPRRHVAHPSLPARLAWLLAFGAAALLAAWLVGYYLLPEGLYRQGADRQMEQWGLAEESGGAAEEWWKIIRHNLLPLALIVLANGLVRVNHVPLGYVVPFYNLLLYGLFIGTNSFAIPYPERLAPSLEILGRAGPYEMAAMLLAAAASATWSRWEVRHIFSSQPERAANGRVGWQQVALLGLGLALLAAAAWREAVMITAL